MRKGLRLLLESQAGFSVVAEASDGHQAVEQAEATKPDVVVLDIGMPRLSGTEAEQRIGELLPGTSVIILSMHSDEGYVMRALKAGAKGYLLKDAAEGDLVEAIRTVGNGKTFFSSEISKMLVEDYVREIRTRGVEDSYELLTSREREILHLLAENETAKSVCHWQYYAALGRLASHLKKHAAVTAGSVRYHDIELVQARLHQTRIGDVCRLTANRSCDGVGEW
jgi:DNA-binding NarL/FixJ family response regulator